MTRRKTGRAAFLDRDGTVIDEREYLADPEGVHLVEGAPEAIRSLRSAGLAVVLVTNQSGIARGLYDLDAYRAVAGRLDEMLAVEGAAPDATRFCPHHPDFTGLCRCRKPGTGMFEDAAAELGVETRGSYYVGDRLKDVLPARELGGTGILVRTGYGSDQAAGAPDDVRVVADLPAAARLILEIEAGRSDPGG